MPFNIPDSRDKRIVIVGAGFAGLTIAKKLKNKDYQVVLVDQNNYHQFQPLFYQVAMSGLEPSSISFPLRQVFRKSNNIYNRIAEVQSVDTVKKEINTSIGNLYYDYLVIATGAKTNYFNNKEIEKNALSMKSVSEALYLRNRILEDYEDAVTSSNKEDKELLTDVVIVGGGPTGVELAGSLAEMRNEILPIEYKEINSGTIEIYLVHGSDRLLPSMDPASGKKAEEYLLEMGVKVLKDTIVQSFDGENVKTDKGNTIRASKVIWAAGVMGNPLEGIPKESIGSGNRVLVDPYCKVKDIEAVYAIGDVGLLIDEKNPRGYPQLAQVAIQQADLVADNFLRELKFTNPKPFTYKDLGTMATIGRYKAVVELPFWKFSGYFAWVVWLFVHLFSLIGLRNKIIVMINWFWSYLNYGQSLRLIIKPIRKDKILTESEVSIKE